MWEQWFVLFFVFVWIVDCLSAFVLKWILLILFFEQLFFKQMMDEWMESFSTSYCPLHTKIFGLIDSFRFEVHFFGEITKYCSYFTLFFSILSVSCFDEQSRFGQATSVGLRRPSLSSDKSSLFIENNEQQLIHCFDQWLVLSLKIPPFPTLKIISYK